MLSILKRFERYLIQVLMIMMAFILLLATLDLGWTITKDISQQTFLIITVDQLLELFGLFMLVIIGIGGSGQAEPHWACLHYSCTDRRLFPDEKKPFLR